MGTFGNNCLVNITCDVFPTQSFFLFRENSFRAYLPKPTHQRDLPLTIECTSVFSPIRKKWTGESKTLNPKIMLTWPGKYGKHIFLLRNKYKLDTVLHLESNLCFWHLNPAPNFHPFSHLERMSMSRPKTNPVRVLVWYGDKYIFYQITGFNEDKQSF